MKRNNSRIEPGNLRARSEAEKLKEQIAKKTGVFRHHDFHAIDNDGRVLEKTFYETGETVQVHLTKSGKIQVVYLLRSRS